MPQPSKIPHIYGYAVCLVAVITFLIALTSLVGAIFDYSDPLHSRRYGNPYSLSSFEAFRMDYERSPRRFAGRPLPESLEPPDQISESPLTEAELRTRYQVLREDQIGQVRHQALKDLVTHSLLLMVCLVLFSTHWFWMRRLHRNES